MRTLFDSVSYALGKDFGMGIAEGAVIDSIPINDDLIVAGLIDGLHGRNTVMEESASQEIMATFQEIVMQRHQERMERESTMNSRSEHEFLEENGRKRGVITTPSGLQYLILTEGSGERPDINDEVTVEYRGWLINGAEFDRSEEGIPVTFPVNGVISGWTEALQLMTEGSSYRLFIPSMLAYGSKGSGMVIGPNETLIFDVTLLDVHKH